VASAGRCVLIPHRNQARNGPVIPKLSPRHVDKIPWSEC